MYKIPLKQCEEVFIGETGRQAGVRLAEHRKETEKTSNMNFTRSISRYSDPDPSFYDCTCCSLPFQILNCELLQQIK